MNAEYSSPDSKALKKQQKELEKQQRIAERAEKARERAKEKAEKARIKRENAARIEEQYGKRVIQEACGGKTVRIYDKGYVQIFHLFGSSAPFEKLLGISGSADVAQKTALGRTLAAGVTMGANLALSPNKRGDLYLSISTSKKVHMIHESPPTERSMKAMHKIVTAGQAVLDATAALHVTSEAPKQLQDQPRPTASASSIADELAKLAALRDSGVLTEDEFQTAKSRLLG